MSNIRQSHPFFKNRINKYLNNPELRSQVRTEYDLEAIDSDQVVLRPIKNNHTLERREAMKTKYGLVKTSNQAETSDYRDTRVETPLPTFNSYYIDEDNTSIYNNSIVITVEKELQGLYCEFPKFNYKTLENDGKSHLDIYITCHRCEICIKRRGLKIMKSIFAKFEVTGVPDYNLYRVTIPLDGLTATKMTNKIRYHYKKQNLEMPKFLLHTTDEKERTVTYLTNGPMLEFNDNNNVNSKITKDEALQIVKPGNKYRFMGKFYGPLLLKTSGLTKKEIEELNLIKPYKSNKCGCGILWKDHDTRGTTAYDMFNTLEPAYHYRRDHELFLDKYKLQMLRVKNNGVKK